MSPGFVIPKNYNCLHNFREQMLDFDSVSFSVSWVTFISSFAYALLKRRRYVKECASDCVDAAGVAVDVAQSV